MTSLNKVGWKSYAKKYGFLLSSGGNTSKMGRDQKNPVKFLSIPPDSCHCCLFCESPYVIPNSFRDLPGILEDAELSSA